MSLSTVELESSYTFLASLGAFYPLSIQFQDHLAQEQIRARAHRWRPYNSSKPDYKRHGLSLFSLDGSDSGEIDLNSVREYNLLNGTNYNELSFRKPTPNWEALSVIRQPLEALAPYLGRSHLIKLDEGGFFPPHRDLGESFRLISFFGCGPRSVYLTLEDKVLSFTQGSLYFLDTRKVHSIFSFQPEALFLVLNVGICRESLTWLANHLLEV